MSQKTKIFVGLGALGVALLAAGYFLTRDSKGCITIGTHSDYFPRGFGDEAGASRVLSEHLGTAFKGTIEYDIKLWIQPDQKRFKGIAEISFEPNESFTGDLYLSTKKLEVYTVRVNNHKIDQNYFNEMTQTQAGSIYIANRHLTKEKLTIQVRYGGNFGDAYGLLSFQDPASQTGESYVFSSTNILGASAIYPCFESLQVRAMFRLSLAVPKGWKALSNEKSDDPEEVDKEFTVFGNDELDPNSEDFHMFKFRQTKSIPFNALNITAGRFAEHKTKTSILGRKLSVYTLESQANKYKELSETCGKVAKAAISRMEKITGAKYPYSKCDILILPDQLIFPSIFATNPIKVAKEYPGLTTVFQRDYRNLKPEFVYELLVSLIRLWFGVLVSVDWWAGVWMTEGFCRYIALRILKEDFSEYELTQNDVHYLNLWLKSQGIYHEIQSDSTRTNLSLTSCQPAHAFEAIFLTQTQAEKVGPFRFEELFSDYPEATLTDVCQAIIRQFSWKTIDAQNFRNAFTLAVQSAPETEVRLNTCFEYPCLDKIKISRTSETTMTVQRINRGENSMNKAQSIEVAFLSKTGEVIKRETGVLTSSPLVFNIDSEVYTFLSVMKSNGLYYEVYEKDELKRLFEIIQTNKQIESEFKMKIARVLLTNTFKCKSLTLVECLEYLKNLITACLPEEQKWVTRCFSVIAKHIDRNSTTEAAIRSFCEFLTTKARNNDGLVPYLCYFGVFDHHCKEVVSSFVSDFDSTTKHVDSTKATLNYDLLKGCMLMIAFCNLDLANAKLYSELVGKYDGAVGSILTRLLECHAEDLVTEHSKIIIELKEIFGTRPSYHNALDYYFKTLLIRTEKTPDMEEVRQVLEKARDESLKHSLGTTNNLVYYNIDKILGASKREESQPNFEDVSDFGHPDPIKDMVSRRSSSNFKLA